MPAQPKYRFYATILDAYSNYVNSDVVWARYWQWSENPPHTPEEFHKMQFDQLIDRINRVPFESEAASKGTAFNEVVDCMVMNRKSSFADISKVYRDNDPATKEVIGVKATLDGFDFTFDINLCREFACYFRGAVPQLFVSATLPTAFGDVELYGYIDELMPFSVHDIKTTGSYRMGKFKDHWQHHVYMYCLHQGGSTLDTIEYNVAEIDRYGRWKTFTESYNYRHRQSVELLTAHCEDFIKFLQENRGLIIDKKIIAQP